MCISNYNETDLKTKRFLNQLGINQVINFIAAACITGKKHKLAFAKRKGPAYSSDKFFRFSCFIFFLGKHSSMENLS